MVSKWAFIALWTITGIAICSCINGCGYLFPPKDDALSITRTPYTGNDLRLDGYYYDTISISPVWISIYFFNRNGTLLWGSTASDSTLPQLKEWFKNGFYYQSSLQYKSCWGVFIVNGTNITYEMWVNSGTGSFQAYKYSGQIINDTTFQIISSERVDGSDHSAENATFHYKHFSPKPDSVVSFIP